MASQRRLLKELEGLHRDLPPGISLASAEGFDDWTMDIKVLDSNPLYQNQIFRLKFRFNYDPRSNYPYTPPEVTFLPSITPPRPIPLHPHVYSNGFICLDLLGRSSDGRSGWSPVHNVVSICVSIQSMLSGNDRAERPPGDENFVRGNRLRPSEVRWVYEDDGV